MLCGQPFDADSDSIDPAYDDANAYVSRPYRDPLGSHRNPLDGLNELLEGVADSAAN